VLSFGCRAQGCGLSIQGLRFRVQGLLLTIQDAEIRVRLLFQVQGVGFLSL
jgi:hypothetical protein